MYGGRQEQVLELCYGSVDLEIDFGSSGLTPSFPRFIERKIDSRRLGCGV